MTTTEQKDIQSLKKSSMWRGVIQTVIGGAILYFLSQTVNYLGGIQDELKSGREKDMEQDSRLNFLEAKDKLKQELIEQLEGGKEYNSIEIKRLIDSLEGNRK